MNYHRIIKEDINNGDGFRVSLFVTGCKFNCLGCWNKELQDPCFGKHFSETEKNIILNELKKPYCAGLSLLGGEPTHENNLFTLTQLTKECKKQFPNKTIWMWTGNVFENIVDLEIIKYLDVVIDGRFLLKERDLTLKWRGSKNQRCISVKETLNAGRIILHYS